MVINVGWENVEIEVDSKIIIDTVKGIMNEGWEIKRVMEYIRHLLIILKRLELHYNFQEGNGVANGLATIGLKVQGLRCWRDLGVLPNLVRLLMNNEIES